MVISEAIGCMSGLAGAFILALNFEYSSFGWLCFLISNIAWICFGIKEKQKGILIMQAGFTATTLLGIYRCFLIF